MVAPTYYLACRIFHDAGFMERLRGVPEDEEGIDLEFLERELQEAEDKAMVEGNNKPVRLFSSVGRIRCKADGFSGSYILCHDHGAKYINTSYISRQRLRIPR